LDPNLEGFLGFPGKGSKISLVEWQWTHIPFHATAFTFPSLGDFLASLNDGNFWDSLLYRAMKEAWSIRGWLRFPVQSADSSWMLVPQELIGED
jgi:hypothetical protein